MNREEQVMEGFWEICNKKNWLDSFTMRICMKGYHHSEMRCIAYIDKNPSANVTKLAEVFFMTRSAISKLTKRLIEKNLIESYRKQGNKKEIYFKLTEQGKTLEKLYGKHQKECRQRDKVIFDQITAEEYDNMLRFVEDYNVHLDAEIKNLGVDITAGN